MTPDLSRRRFLHTAALASGAAVIAPESLCAVEPFPRQGPPRLQLSLAAYSFRKYLPASISANDFAPGKRKFDLFQFLDYCAGHGVAGAELTSYYFPKDVDADFLLRIRRHAFLRGVDISGTAVGNTFTLPPGEKRDAEIALVKKWTDHAAVLGAPHIRVFAGNVPKDSTKEEAKKRSIEALEECADYSGKKGIFLGIENHGGIVGEAADLIDIIKSVKNPWVGINLDSGNFHTDDPYADFARCAPWAVNVQMKGEIRRRDAKQNEPADLARQVKALRDVGYQGYVALEYESAEDPFTAIPPLLKKMRELFGS